MPTAHTRVIAANEYRRERWRNGFGWTREIARIAIDAPHVELDAEDDAWDLRLSIAEIEQDAPFSLFPGVDRELVLLSGAGIVLDFDDAASIPVEPPHGRHAFAGERAVTARLIDGRTHLRRPVQRVVPACHGRPRALRRSAHARAGSGRQRHSVCRR